MPPSQKNLEIHLRNSVSLT